MASIRFPEVSFDWLARLPQVADEARALRETRRVLSEKQPKSIADLESQAAQLAPYSPDIALKLYGIANTRRGIEQRGAMDALNIEILKSLRDRGKAPGSEDFTPTIPAAPVEPTPAPSTAPQAPFPSPGGGNVLPRGTVGAAAPPTQTADVLDTIRRVNQPREDAINPALPPAPGASPSEALLAAAEGPAPQAPPVRLAGPPPTPDTAPSGLPTPGVSPAFDAARIPAPPRMAPPSAPPATPAPMSQPIIQQQARDTVVKLGSELATFPPRFTQTSYGKAAQRQWENALTQSNMKPDELSYQQELMGVRQENNQRREEGRPLIPEPLREDFKAYTQAAVNRLKEVGENYDKTYKAKGEKGRSMIDALSQMSSIINHSRFVPGDSYVNMASDKLRNLAGSLTQQLRVLGVSDALLPSKESIASATEPVALRELFTSLANQMVTSGLGGLSKSISDADRNFLQAAFPHLSQTEVGMKKIIGYLTEISKRDRMEQRWAQDYLETNKYRANSWGLDSYVTRKGEEYGEKNRLVVQPGETVDQALVRESVPVRPPAALPTPALRAPPSVNPASAQPRGFTVPRRVVPPVPLPPGEEE